MMTEQLLVNGTSLPLLNSINPSLTFSINDISQPDKRKSTFSKTINIPNSKITSKVFTGVFDINIEDGSFDTTKRADMEYIVDGEVIMQGYLQLVSVDTTDINDISYNVVLFGNTSDLFSKIKGKELSDLDFTEYNHPLTRNNVSLSWEDSYVKNGIPTPFELGRGYVYPLIDYGYTTDQIIYKVTELSPALYAKEYVDKIFASAGATYTSTFLNSTLFKRLIIPSSPSMYSLTSADIQDRQFSVNTPLILETGTTQSNNLPLESLSPTKIITFSNEVSDPSNRFDPVTGGFTVLATGVYNLNTIIDVSGTFTPNNLSNFLLTTSEVRGTIQLVLNGTTVIDQTDFYFSPTNQSVGVRSTDATPTLPDPDYRPSITTDKDNVGVIFRGVNPPNRYVLGINGITLTISDVITVRYSAGFFKYDDANNYFQNSLGSLPIDGNAKLNIAVGGFSNIAVNQTIGYSNTVDVNRAIPKGYKQDEYIKDLINMFNLQIEPDKLINNHFIIEPFDDYYLNTKTNDWSEKHAINKKSTITPTGKQKNKTYIYDFKSDKDHYNALYEESYQEIYGHRDVEASNEFLKGTYHTKVSFSPTPLVSDPNGEIVIPRIVKLNDNQQAVPTKFNRRILYYGGLKGNPNGGDLTNPWRLNDGAGLSNEYQYPYAGHFDDPFNATLDINFGLVKEVYYDDNISSITITTANLYNVYHRNMMNGILDKKGKTFEGFFHLTPTDIYTLSFRDLFYHNNAYWRLLKISNYNPTNDELVKCEFQKVVNLNIPTNIVEENIDGADDIKTTLPIPSNPIDDTEVIPVKNFFSNQQEDSNNYNPKSTNINGENNYVSRTSTNIEILGDGNRVSSNVDTVSLLNSNNNFIGAGVRNVTLINSNNLEVLVSDVTYFNGSIVNEDIDHHSGFNNIKLGQTVLISQDKQMTNWNKLTNNGTLKIEGDLILR